MTPTSGWGSVKSWQLCRFTCGTTIGYWRKLLALKI